MVGRAIPYWPDCAVQLLRYWWQCMKFCKLMTGLILYTHGHPVITLSSFCITFFIDISQAFENQTGQDWLEWGISVRKREDSVGPSLTPCWTSWCCFLIKRPLTWQTVYSSLTLVCPWLTLFSQIRQTLYCQWGRLEEGKWVFNQALFSQSMIRCCFKWCQLLVWGALLQLES